MTTQTEVGEVIHLTMKPYKLSEMPSEEQLYRAAEKVIAEVKAWKKGKTFNRHNTIVHTMSKARGPYDEGNWHARHSVHPSAQVTFDEFWEGLSVDKAAKETEFIPELKRTSLLKQVSENQFLSNLYYEFPPPISPRVFTELQVVRAPFGEVGSREGYVITLPIDLSDEKELGGRKEKGVRGRYVSVEHLKELPDGNIEWCMATQSTAGGSIPKFIAERSLPSSIAWDVPHFLEWLAKKRYTVD